MQLMIEDLMNTIFYVVTYKMKKILLIMFCMIMLVGVVSAADYKFQDSGGDDLMIVHGDTANVSITGNVSATAGFFSWIGSLTDRITKLFIQDIDFTGLINGSGWINTTANISASYYYGDGSKLINLPSGTDGALNSSAWNRSSAGVFLHRPGDKVGIGTTTPEGRLHIGGNTVVPEGSDEIIIDASAPTIHFADNTASADDYWFHVNDNKFYLLLDTNDDGVWESPHPMTFTGRNLALGGDLSVTGGNLNLDDTTNAQNSRIDWYATDGDTGYVEYTTSDRWEWRNGGFYIRNEVPITYIYSNLIYLGTSGDTTTTYLQGNIMTGDKFRLEAASGSLALGSASDPGIYELDVVGQAYVSGYLVALGGIYAGATGDPGTDNLIIYGNLVASANSRESMTETTCSDGAACYCPSGKIMYGINDKGGDEYNIYCAEL
jgi:hypothetical protein